MPVTMLCPNLRCRAILQVPDHCRGKRVRCGKCGIALAVPLRETPPKPKNGQQQPSDQTTMPQP